jgi:hypothetical protein
VGHRGMGCRGAACSPAQTTPARAVRGRYCAGGRSAQRRALGAREPAGAVGPRAGSCTSPWLTKPLERNPEIFDLGVAPDQTW